MMTKKKVLIIRFSALGDVAMTIPVVYSLARQNAETEFVFLSKPALRKLFFNAPSNIRFEEIDYRNRHQGFKGLIRLFFELRKQKFTQIADLHSVLRSHIITNLFRLSFTQIASIDKQRQSKRDLIKAASVDKKQLPTSFERYEKVFHKLGFTINTDFRSIFETKGDISKLGNLVTEKKEKWLGIAPFAKHVGKIYPIEKMEKVIEILSKENTKIYLFGGGNYEKEILQKWEIGYPNVISLVGKIDMEKELILMSHLDGMVTMDSGNMHLASLVGCPVISVWGATHILAGFYGWNQNPEDAVQIDLDCRPCSIYGNKDCHRGDYACLNEISPEALAGRIKSRFL